MQPKNIYSDGRYFSRNRDWHLSDSATKVKWIKRILPDEVKSSTMEVLEIGCGRGAVLAGLRDVFPSSCKFTGMDISAEAISYAREHYQGLQFLCCDVASMQLNQHYDIVFCIDLLEHLYFQRQFLEKVRQISRYSVFHVPLGNNLKNKLFDRWKQQITKYGHIQFYDTGSLITAFADAGLAIRDYQYTFGLEYPKYRKIYPFTSWLFRLSPYVISQTVGLVSLMLLTESVENL